MTSLLIVSFSNSDRNISIHKIAFGVFLSSSFLYFYIQWYLYRLVNVNIYINKTLYLFLFWEDQIVKTGLNLSIYFIWFKLLSAVSYIAISGDILELEENPDNQLPSWYLGEDWRCSICCFTFRSTFWIWKQLKWTFPTSSPWSVSTFTGDTIVTARREFTPSSLCLNTLWFSQTSPSTQRPFGISTN